MAQVEGDDDRMPHYKITWGDHGSESKSGKRKEREKLRGRVSRWMDCAAPDPGSDCHDLTRKVRIKKQYTEFLPSPVHLQQPHRKLSAAIPLFFLTRFVELKK